MKSGKYYDSTNVIQHDDEVSPSQDVAGMHRSGITEGFFGLTETFQLQIL